MKELQALVAKVRTKLDAGTRTEAGLSDELKALEALYDKNRTGDLAVAENAAAVRAILCIQVLGQTDKAVTILQQARKDLPNSVDLQSLLTSVEHARDAEKMQAALKPGTAFPDFNVKDLAGAPLSVASYKGKVVLIDFWATWCGPCVAELPNVLAAYEKYHAKGFDIIGVSLDESEAKLKAFIADKKMPWRQYFDGKGWENEVSTKYGIQSIPATFLLDRDGKIVAKDLRGEELDKELERLLQK